MDGELLVRQKPECLVIWMLVTTPWHYVWGTTRLQGHCLTLSTLMIYLVLPVVTQYHVQSQHHIVMGVGEQYVLWITVLTAWLEQILWPYLEQYQDTSHQHYLSSLHSALALTIARQT